MSNAKPPSLRDVFQVGYAWARGWCLDCIGSPVLRFVMFMGLISSGLLVALGCVSAIVNVLVPLPHNWTIVLGLSFLGAAGVLMLLAHEAESKTTAVSCIAGTALAVIVVFALAYWSHFSIRPTAYSFSESIREGRYRSEVRAAGELARSFDDRILTCHLLDRAVADLTEEGALASEDISWDLPGGRRFIRGSRLDNSLDIPSTEPFLEVVNPDGDASPTDRRITLVDAGTAGGKQLFNARTRDEFRAGLRAVMGELGDGQAAEIHRIERAMRDDPEFGFFDMFYLSVGAFTTSGSGDILPNSDMARALVTAEALVALFLLVLGVELVIKK